jgi:Clathrin light chain
MTTNFPSIEEFDSGVIMATKVEDADDDNDLLNSGGDDFLAREQAILGADAQFFQSGVTNTSSPTQGEASFFGNAGGVTLVRR